MWVRELLNERKWGRGDLGSLEVVVRHRGSPGDVRVVFGGEIGEIRPGGLLVRADPYLDEGVADDGQVFLPWHRVLQVRGPEGVLWARPEAPDPERPVEPDVEEP